MFKIFGILVGIATFLSVISINSAQAISLTNVSEYNGTKQLLAQVDPAEDSDEDEDEEESKDEINEEESESNY
jgi:nucleosome binding factor SPN SPT16 subunit